MATGNVDIHCHILPGLDDGAPNMEIAVGMARMAAKDGTTHLVATPHANFQFRYDPTRIAALRDELQAAAGDQLQILIGCDFHLSYENVQDALAHPRKYSVNGGQYLLVEFAEMFNIASMAAILRQLREQGLIPVLTHPERNPVFQQHPELAPRYIELGCIVQVTASSLTGDFGKQAARSAADLLDRNLIHVLASDGHSTRHRLPRLSEAAQFVAERKDEQLARALVSDNPAAIIADRPLPYRPNGAVRTSRKKGLWSRFRS